MGTERIQNLFNSQLVCVNIGPQIMGEALEKQNLEVVQVDWRPTAGGDREMQELLAALGGF